MAQVEDGLVLKLGSIAAKYNEKMILKKDFYFDNPQVESGFQNQEELKEDEIQMFDFSK